MGGSYRDLTATVYKDYGNKVYRLALSITRNERDAEDVAQNVFIKVFKNLKYFRKESKVSTWIYRIAYNESLMFLRKRRSLNRLSRTVASGDRKGPAGLFVNWAKMPDAYALDEEMKQQIDESVRSMPIQYRMALHLHALDGLSIKESAAILRLKADSFKTRLHRARMLIRSGFSEYLKDHPQGAEQQPAGPKTCSIMTGFISRYADGSMQERTHKAFDRHIADCRGCKEFLRSYAAAIRVSKALECRDLPSELQDKIKKFILKK